MKQGACCFWVGLAIFLAVLVGDQATKLWVEQTFSLGESVPVFRPWFALTYVRNQGAAWGMFQGAQLFLGGIGVAACVLLVLFRRALFGVGRGVWPVLGLLLAGILGNVIDRFRLGYVVDFIHVYWGAWHFPCFNVADSAICLAVAGLLLCQVFHRHEA